MSRYALCYSFDYVPKWTVVEGVREIFQNAVDEETRSTDNKMGFSYDASKEELLIWNEKGALDRSTLLTGFSTKRSNSDLIGQQGEGYKVGVLAILRDGCSVTIYNYSKREVWKAEAVFSKKYNSKILSFDITKSRVSQGKREGVLFKITGFNSDMYKKVYAKNLTIQSLDSSFENVFKTSKGTLLRDEKYKGNIYVSGLFVCNNKELSYGYDFPASMLSLDRDRSLVESFNLLQSCALVLSLVDDIEFLKTAVETKDATLLSITFSNNIKCLCNTMFEDFTTANGTDSIPVRSQEEYDSALLAHKNPVFVSSVVKELLFNADDFSADDYSTTSENIYSALSNFLNVLSDRMTPEEINTKNSILRLYKSMIY